MSDRYLRCRSFAGHPILLNIQCSIRYRNLTHRAEGEVSRGLMLIIIERLLFFHLLACFVCLARVCLSLSLSLSLAPANMQVIQTSTLRLAKTPIWALAFNATERFGNLLATCSGRSVRIMMAVLHLNTRERATNYTDTTIHSSIQSISGPCSRAL